MAQIDIRNLTRVNKERNTIHDQVYATYTVFDNNGKKYLQIDSKITSNGFKERGD